MSVVLDENELDTVVEVSLTAIEAFTLASFLVDPAGFIASVEAGDEEIRENVMTVIANSYNALMTSLVTSGATNESTS